jgi:hypothetical protein
MKNRQKWKKEERKKCIFISTADGCDVNDRLVFFSKQTFAVTQK